MSVSGTQGLKTGTRDKGQGTWGLGFEMEVEAFLA